MLITFTLALSFGSINDIYTNNSNVKEPDLISEMESDLLQKSGFWTETHIYIDNNWTDTNSTYDWCSGSGTWDDPYVIENVTVDAGDSGSCIEISNTDEYFLINNCTIRESDPSSGNAGIYMINVNNGTIINSHIYHCFYGIRADTCYNNTFSFNNVSDNTGSSTSGYGIYLRSGSSNNTIYNNTVVDNGDEGIYLFINCDYNNISKNYVYNNDNHGIYVVGNLDANSCDFNNITDNWVENNGGEVSTEAGIYCQRAWNCTISNNNVIDNKGEGISLLMSKDCYISNNLVTENDDHGFYLDQDCLRNTISKNEITNNEINDGIQIESDCDYNIFYNNIIQGNNEYGVRVDQATSNDNLFYKNFFNGSGIANAYDTGNNNLWNNTNIGNYWDDYGGVDTNRDGIGETSYDVTPPGGTVDSLPIYGNPIHNGSRIHIDENNVTGDGTWAWASTRLWCEGSGTYLDPYIVKDLEIDGQTSGSCIIIEDSNVFFRIENCKITNSGTNSYDGGIKIDNSDNGVLENNNCSNNGENGIILYANCENHTIINNIVNDNTVSGIYLYWFADDIKVINNTANSSFYGIMLERTSNSLVANNTVTNSDNYGIVITNYSDENNITGNVASNLGTSTQWRGIVLEYDCDDNNIINNSLKDNTNYGIHLYDNCRYNKIRNNTVDDNDLYGIYVQECDNNTINENLIINHSNRGIYLPDTGTSSDSNLIYNNTCIGNSEHARDNGDYNDWNYTDTGNYWDDYSGYDVDDDGRGDNPYDISGTANSKDYWPIWDDGPTSDVCSIHIDDSGVSGNGTWSWAEAQWWCSGSGIITDPYIFADLLIDGQNSGSGIIIANSTKHFRIENCTIYQAGGAAGNAGIHLDNVTNGQLIGNNCSYNNYAGIYLNEESNENNIENNTLSYNTVHGLFLANGDDNNSVVNNTVNENGNTGIYLEVSNSGNWIINNTCSNEGSYNQNTGIQVGNGGKDNRVIDNELVENVNYGINLGSNCGLNNISNNYIESSGEYGIYLTHSDNNTLNNNTIVKSNQYAIYFDQSNNNSVQNNRFLNSTEHGVYLFASHLNNFTENIIEHNGVGTYYGIYLDNSDNNTFSNNNITFSSSDGIWIEYCDGNVFFLNNILNNSRTGVNIEATSINMLFYNNSFIGNLVNAQDNGTNNWNNSIIGNYWDDYNGVDINGDEIGESPYLIPGSGGSNDSLPICSVSAGYWILDPIKIDGIGINGSTWEETASKPWCQGSGTWQDPYVLENITINAQGSEYCILVQFSTTKYFEIRNCTLRGSSGPDTAGLLLNLTNNGKILDNNCSLNQDSGILLWESQNNTIQSNVIHDLPNWGIRLIRSNNNTINENNLYDNSYSIFIYFSNSSIISSNNASDNSFGIFTLFFHIIESEVIIQIKDHLPLQLFAGEYEPIKFTSVKNFEGLAPHNKSLKGGLWTSTFVEEIGSMWVKWMKQNDYFDKARNFLKHPIEPPKVCTVLEVLNGAHIIEINSYEDLSSITNKYLQEFYFPFERRDEGEVLKHLDFEKLATDYDALHFTEKGIEESKNFWVQPNIMGIEVESTLWFNILFLKPLKIIPY